MTTVENTPEANAIATIVTDRCHGNRKPGKAPERYAIIWQAARLGALEAMKRPTHLEDAGGFVCAGCARGPEQAAAFMEAARGMREALESINRHCLCPSRGTGDAETMEVIGNEASEALATFDVTLGEQ